jgi:hypothetical protein
VLKGSNISKDEMNLESSSESEHPPLNKLNRNFDRLVIQRSIHSEEAQLSETHSLIRTPRGSCGSNEDIKKKLFMKNDELFAKEIHYTTTN